MRILFAIVKDVLRYLASRVGVFESSVNTLSGCNVMNVDDQRLTEGKDRDRDESVKPSTYRSGRE